MRRSVVEAACDVFVENVVLIWMRLRGVGGEDEIVLVARSLLWGIR